MKLLMRIPAVLFRGFAVATPTALVMMLVYHIADEEGLVGISLSQFLLVLGFSMLISLFHEVLLLRSMSLVARVAIQYVGLLVGFILLFLVAGKIAPDAGKVFIYVVVFTLFYAVILAAFLLTARFTGYFAKHIAREFPEDRNA